MATRIYVVTAEEYKPRYVATVNNTKLEAMGDNGVELLCLEFCEKHNLCYMDFTLEG